MPVALRPTRALFALLALLSASSPLRAQFGPPDAPPAPNGSEDPVAPLVRKTHEENVAKYGKDADKLVRPGLLADRKTKQVRIWAKATGIDLAAPVEFFLIPPDSGKDYEALAVAYVKPSDVHKALEFIGLPPGRPVDHMRNRYWPKGERIHMTFEWQEKGKPRRARAEELIIDIRTKKPLPLTGLIFTGSFMIKPEDGGPPMYAADVADPRSIASNYNDRGTVMDLPRRAPQGEVYGFQKANPAFHFETAQPIQILLEPEHKDGKRRVRDLTLTASAPGPAATLKQTKFSLTDHVGKPVTAGNTVVHLFAAVEELLEAGHDPYVTIQPADQMSLATVRELYKLLMTMDNEAGLRIEAPPDGHLYYRAFFPDEKWRDRDERLGRPWELHVEPGEPIKATLILPADKIDDNQGRGDLKFPVTSPQQVADVLVRNSDRWSQTIYIFAPQSTAYGALMTFLRPAMETHDTIYVFP